MALEICRTVSSHRSSALSQLPALGFRPVVPGTIIYRGSCRTSLLSRALHHNSSIKNKPAKVSTCASSSSSETSTKVQSVKDKIPFGYTRKDVLLIGLGVTGLGVGLKSGLEFFGVDSLQAGNVVQLVMVLGLTVGWIASYIFRVSNKDMTYAQQLRDYESKVMQKRLETLTESELEALLEQVEEEKRRIANIDQV